MIKTIFYQVKTKKKKLERPALKKRSTKKSTHDGNYDYRKRLLKQLQKSTSTDRAVAYSDALLPFSCGVLPHLAELPDGLDERPAELPGRLPGLRQVVLPTRLK